MKQDDEQSRVGITIAITGGLGNQLFQYAAARSLSLRTGANLSLDRSFYRRRRHRTFELGSFSELSVRLATTNDRSPLSRLGATLSRLIGRRTLPVYREPHFHFDPAIAQLQPPIRLEGYFQSPRYFADQAEIIRQELAPPEAIDPSSLRLAAEIAAGETTALHIRRGDYVSNPHARSVYAGCSLDYYERAMSQIPGTNPVYVFSDDIPWATAHIRPVKPLVFVAPISAQSGLRDLWLMTKAHHHIIANSTFSWWGCWLAGPRKGLSIAPQRWFNDPAVVDQDLIPADWLRLEN